MSWCSGGRIDLDHILDWARRGHTAEHNLGPFCEKHHIDKHHTRWQVQQPAPGHYHFTSPTGHTYTRHPTQTGPITTNPPDNPDHPGDPDPPDNPPF